MRRLSLSTKLLIAVLPLIIALGGLLTITIRNGLTEIDNARLGADLGSTWEPLVATIRAVESERSLSATGTPTEITQARRQSNDQMVAMDAALRRLGDSQPVLVQLGQALSSLGLARGAVDNPATGVARGLSADDSFNATKADLVAVGRLLPAEAGDSDLARHLTAVAALAEVEQGSIVVLNRLESSRAGNATDTQIDRLLVQIDRVDSSVDLFRATAEEEWTNTFRTSGYHRALGDTRRVVQEVVAARAAGNDGATISADQVEHLRGPVTEIATLRDDLALDVVASANSNVDDITSQTLVRVAATALAVLVALGLAYLITRSITSRVRAVSGAAREVSTERLPVLVDALRDPRGRTALPGVVEIDARGSDELAELASSFNILQETLGNVATEQIEVLRRGVSDIFVTMARRNRSLVDRQLALLDELEAGVEDPAVLSDYYRLDHLATRMRRNSESLLVLANTDTSRRRSRPAPIDDVVRAAIGEVEEYRRIDILSLEHLNVRGAVVADVAHLLAELLDNATAYSPPTSRVQITGDLIDDEYRILIIDEGMGMSAERLTELNDLLAHPPVIGLSVEPTLGMSVVSLLAAKNDLRVTLSSGKPGLIVKVVLPSTVFERRAGERPGDDVELTSIAPLDSIPEPLETSETVETVVTGEPVVAPAAPAAAISRRQRRAEQAAARAQAKRLAKGPASRAKKRQKHAAAGEKVAPDVPATNGPSHEVIGEPLGLGLRLPQDVIAQRKRHTAEEQLEIHPADDDRIDASELTDLVNQTPADQDVSPASVEPPPPIEPAPLPVRSTTGGTKPAAETTLDLADIDITPSWARHEPADEPRIPPPATSTPVPPPPPPSSRPLGAPAGPMLAPPTGAPSSGGPMAPPAIPSRPPRPEGISLPTRPRSSSSALLESDRLDESPTAPGGPPAALKAALSAFDLGRRGRIDTGESDENGDRA